MNNVSDTGCINSDGAGQNLHSSIAVKQLPREAQLTEGRPCPHPRRAFFPGRKYCAIFFFNFGRPCFVNNLRSSGGFYPDVFVSVPAEPVQRGLLGWPDESGHRFLGIDGKESLFA